MRNRPLFFLLCSIFILPLTTVAQEVEIPSYKSIKGGIVFSSLKNTSFETHSNPGFAIGLSVDIRFHTSLSLQPEIFYIEKGSRVSTPSIDTDFDLTMDYIEIPVLAKYRLSLPGIAQPYFYSGPYVSFLIENNSSIEVMGDQEFTPDELVQEARNTDWGVILGVGTELNFTFNRVTTELRYGAGISSAFNDTIDRKIRNSFISLLVGFHF